MNPELEILGLKALIVQQQGYLKILFQILDHSSCRRLISVPPEKTVEDYIDEQFCANFRDSLGALADEDPAQAAQLVTLLELMIKKRK